MIDIVCSVPHSGTRSLVLHLGLADNSPRGRWLHFGYRWDQGYLNSGAYHLHIPVREPLAVAASHARRGKNLDALVHAYEDMFERLSQPHTLHRMSEVPRLDGTEDTGRNRYGDVSVERYCDTIVERVIEPHQDWWLEILGDNHARDTLSATG